MNGFQSATFVSMYRCEFYNDLKPIRFVSFFVFQKTLNFNNLNDTQRDTTLKKEGKKDSQKTDLTKNATKKTRATLVVFKIDGRRRQRREEAASDERRRAQPGERESGKVTVERRPGRRAECGACVCALCDF